MNDQVVLGFISAGNPELSFMSSVIRLIYNPDNRLVSVISVHSGPKIDDARNSLFNTWLDETNADYLLMVDDDMVLPPNVIQRLMSHRKDIVGALCFSEGIGGKVRPVIHVIEEEDDKPTINVLYNYPTNSLLRVAGTGGACLLVTRRAAKSIREQMGDHVMPFFAFGMHHNVKIGEDIAFCLRASKAGFDTWVDTGIVIPHIKKHTVTEVEFVRSLMMEDHPYYDERGKVPIFRELTSGNTSQHSDKQSGERLPGPVKP